MDQSMLAFMFLGGGGRTAGIAKLALPSTLQIPPSQRFAMAALIASREIKQRDETLRDVIQDVVTSDKIRDPDTLRRKYAKLHAIFAALPDTVRNSIKYFTDPTPAPDSPRGKS